MLGHSTIFLRKTRDIKDVFQSAIFLEVKKAYEKLKSQCLAGVRNISRRRPASLQDVCHKNCDDKDCRGFFTFEGGHLFKNGTARRAFKKILKYRCCKSVETSPSALIIFDIVKPDTIQSFLSAECLET